MRQGMKQRQEREAVDEAAARARGSGWRKTPQAAAGGRRERQEAAAVKCSLLQRELRLWLGEEVAAGKRRQGRGNPLGQRWSPDVSDQADKLVPLASCTAEAGLISSERSQIGVGHNFRYHTTGWKWKLSACFGGDGISQIRNKTSVHVFPAMTIRFGWRAEYILPEVHGAIGAGEPVIGMNYGRLYASLDRVETILTHKA
ncbi:hypothetical protein EJ110_NYTH60155 [Nymphaea thermarum]|nr:hypothetical protein EJ110_NYTH60155 [Nymphaea thermarum]